MDSGESGPDESVTRETHWGKWVVGVDRHRMWVRGRMMMVRGRMMMVRGWMMMVRGRMMMVRGRMMMVRGRMMLVMVTVGDQVRYDRQRR